MKYNEIIKNFPDNLGSYNFVENLSVENIRKIDESNMYALLTDYWIHIGQAINAAIVSKDVVFNEQNITEILILGIGGSAMSGELLRSYLKYLLKEKCPQITINRGWDIPYNVNEKTCVFVCSYSGNTEETLAAFEKTRKLTDNIIAVTSGGKLAEICKQNNYHILKMPIGMMPRCAMFYSFFHLIFVLSRQNIINSKDFSDAIDVIVANRYETKLDYSTINNNNLTIAIAKLITNKIPLIYSNQGNLEAVNLRWRAQIQENSNQMCFGNFYPELNHNEINGWSLPAELIDKFVVIAIKDEADSAELNETLTNSLELLKESNRNVIELTVEGEFLLDRMVKLICIADWVSFYLAIFNNVDPTPIPEIAKLKKRKEK